jgi:hypothetical protein
LLGDHCGIPIRLPTFSVTNEGPRKPIYLPKLPSYSALYSHNMVDPFSTVLGVTQLAELLVKVLDGLCGYFENLKNAPTQSQELQNELLVLSQALKNIESACKSSENYSHIDSTFNQFITPLRSMLEGMETKIIPKGQITFKRLKWPFTAKENAEYLAKIERYKTTLAMAFMTLQRYGQLWT